MDISSDYAGSGTHINGYLSYGVDGWFESNASLSSSSLKFESDGAFEVVLQIATATDLAFYVEVAT